MRVTSSGQILRARSVLNADHCFGNHFSCSWSDDVSSQQLVCLLFREYFDYSVSVGDSFSSGIGQEREASLDIVDV